MFVKTKEIIEKNKIVPALNFSTAEVAKAIIETCDSLSQDVILQTSQKEAEFLSPKLAFGIASSLSQNAKIRVSLHLDHAKDLDLIAEALKAGYTSFLADGSELAFDQCIDFVRYTKELAGDDIVVEAGLTEFSRAKEFVDKTKLDLLAPFQLDGKRDATELKYLEEVHGCVKTPLVFHNSSNKSNEDLAALIDLGVVKVNFNTCLRRAWAEGLKESMTTDEIKPYILLAKSIENVKIIVEEKVKIISHER